MPEDISHEPANYQLIKDLGQPAFTKVIAERSLKDEQFKPIELSIEKIQRVIPIVTEQIKVAHPELSSSKIRQLIGLYFGSYSMDPAVLRRDLAGSEMEALPFAELQHSQAHAIFYAGSGKAEEAYTNSIFNTMVTNDNLARSQSAIVEGVARKWNGVKAQLGVMRLLDTLGHSVFLPDYQGVKNYLDHEVLEWDIRHKTDMVSIDDTKDGSIMLLVDAKGQYNYPKEDELKRSGPRIQADVRADLLSSNDESRLPASLQLMIKQIDPIAVFQTRIIIPTANEKLTSVRDAYMVWEGDKVQTLKHFSEVSQDVEDRVQLSLEKLPERIPYID